MRSLPPLMLVTALLLVGCGGSEPDPTPTRATSREDATGVPLVASVDGVGGARIGFTREEALATRLFDADVPGVDGCPVRPLAWKARYARVLDVVTDDAGTIDAIGVRGPEVRTATDLGVGSTLGQLRQTYDDLSDVREVGSDQSAVFLERADRWLGFLLEAPLDRVDDTTEVVFMEARHGERPALVRDGC